MRFEPGVSCTRVTEPRLSPGSQVPYVVQVRSQLAHRDNFWWRALSVKETLKMLKTLGGRHPPLGFAVFLPGSLGGRTFEAGGAGMRRRDLPCCR